MSEGNFHPEGLISKIADTARNIGQKVARPVAGGMVLGGGVVGAAMDTPSAYADTPTPIVRPAATVVPGPTATVREMTPGEWSDMATKVAKLKPADVAKDPTVTPTPNIPKVNRDQEYLDKMAEAEGKENARIREQVYQRYPERRPKTDAPAGVQPPAAPPPTEAQAIRDKAKQTLDLAKAVEAQKKADAALEKAQNSQFSSGGIPVEDVAKGAAGLGGGLGAGLLGAWLVNRFRQKPGSESTSASTVAPAVNTPEAQAAEQVRQAAFQRLRVLLSGIEDPMIRDPEIKELDEFIANNPGGTVAQHMLTRGPNIRTNWETEEAKRIVPTTVPTSPAPTGGPEHTPGPVVNLTPEQITQRRTAAETKYQEVSVKLDAIKITDSTLAEYVREILAWGEEDILKNVNLKTLEDNVEVINAAADVLVGNSGISVDDFIEAVCLKIPAAEKDHTAQYLKTNLGEIKKEMENEKAKEDEEVSNAKSAIAAETDPARKAVLDLIQECADKLPDPFKVKDGSIRSFVRGLRAFGNPSSMNMVRLQEELEIAKAAVAVLADPKINVDAFKKAVSEKLTEPLKSVFLKNWEPVVTIVPDANPDAS